MEILIQIEELIMFLGCIYLFSRLNIKWWWFPVLLLLPDLAIFDFSFTCRVVFVKILNFGKDETKINHHS
ncbi:DUF4260 family protein [Flavobacterium flavigenum]|uniref:DUF4260 family protein n=1 Tax=Flavobacterium flavigenum TaxID=3003258 RepID=UPI0022AC22B6|nr:DUF4260 family protein [Flavobacterium flavigenum]